MMALLGDTGLRTPSVYQVSNSQAFPFGRYDALPVLALVGLVTLKLVTLTFDLKTGTHTVLQTTWRLRVGDLPQSQKS